MEMPSETAGTDTILDTYGEHHDAALGADPAAAAIAAEFSPRQAALRAALEARFASERALTRLMALGFTCEGDIEECIRNIEGRVLLAVGKDRDEDPYAGAFPGALTGALKYVGKAQSAEFRRIAGLLASDDRVPADARSLLPNGERLACALDSSVDRCDAAVTALGAALTAEAAERRRWLEQYRKDFGLLTAVYPKNRARVERFFKKPARKPRKGGGGGGGSGTP